MTDSESFDFFGADAYADEAPARRPERPRAAASAGYYCRSPQVSLTRPEHAEEVRSVTDLCLSLSQVIRGQFGACWVGGEIAGFTRASSGHWYFELKDARSRIHCVMFASDASRVRFQPQVGDKVEAYGKPDLYAPQGRLQMKITAMRRGGVGNLYEQFEALKRKLLAEGLFDAAAKRPVPAMPAAVGIVSSLGAAGLRDALRILSKRAPYARIIIYPASVQGRDAPAEIAAALGKASARAETDVVLLVRGGGSFEDLAAFNSEAVARAVRACRIPVITGIGHEVDTTIADLAADLRAATPTAAAVSCARDAAELAADAAGLERRLREAASGLLAAKAQRVDLAGLRLASPAKLLASRKERVEQLRGRLASLAGVAVLERKLALSRAEAGLRQAAAGAVPAKKSEFQALSSRLAAARPGIASEFARAERLRMALASAFMRRARAEESRVSAFGERLQKFSPQGRLAAEQERIRAALRALRAGEKAYLAARRSECGALEARFLAYDFMGTLRRGYAIVLGDSGDVVRSASALAAGSRAKVLMADGSAVVRVLSTDSEPPFAAGR